MPARSLLTKVSIKADASGNAPSEIELLRTGTWHTPWHGDFEITLADLHEFAANFAKGVGLVEADKKAPINYAHESWDKAAAWVPKVRVDEEREALVAYDIEWTPAAIDALKAGEWRYLSPEFNPRGFPWEDPEAEFEFVDNVLTGAALTNIPLFKKLKPIMASRVPSPSKKADVTSGDGNKPNREGDKMNLEDIRKKQVADLTDEEKTFLGEHKDELTDDERTAFGLVDDADADADKGTDADAGNTDDDADQDADADKGNVQASAEIAKLQAKVARLEADAKAGREAKAELEQKKANDIVGGAIKAGQIKSGDKDKWVKQLLASRGESRTNLEALISTLPKNDELGKELGDKGAAVEASAQDDLNVKASALAKESNIGYSAALKEVLASDKELRDRVDAERNESN